MIETLPLSSMLSVSIYGIVVCRFLVSFISLVHVNSKFHARASLFAHEKYLVIIV